MIPVGLPSLPFVLLVVFLLGTTLLWLVWTASLVFTPAGQRLEGLARKAAYALISCIALFTLYKIVDLKLQMAAYHAEMTAKFAPTLETAQRLGQLEMPAQTRLSLAIENTPESFNQALFPEPVAIAGISARQVERYIAIQTDENHQTQGFQPKTMRVIGDGVAVQQGWLCDAAEPIEFDLHEDGSIASFSRCVLAAGNRVDGIDLPKVSSVWQSQGLTYTDGFVDKDRWVIDTPSGQVVEAGGVSLIAPVIMLTGDRTLHAISRAVLAQEAVLDHQQYPAGAAVEWNPRSHRGQWLVGPSPQQPSD